MATETKTTLAKKSVADLRELADDHGIDYKGIKKADLAILILRAIEAADEEEDDEVEDDDIELDEDEEEDDSDSVDDDEEDDDDDLELPEEDEVEEEDDEEDEVVEEPKKKAPKKKRPEPSGDTYTAKQVATRIGTDAKTLRKFFRSPASTIEPVGQGGRYEFAKEDVPTIQAEFAKWQSAQTAARPAKGRGVAKPKGPKPEVEELEDDSDEWAEDQILAEDGNDELDLDMDDEEDDEEED